MTMRFLVSLCISFFLITFGVVAEAGTYIGVGLVVPSAPPPPPPVNVVMMPPNGYSNCYMTEGAWYGNVWVPPHQECAYTNSASPSLWVSGYWGCLAVGPHGNCGRWRWYSNRWERRGPQVAVYYNHGGYDGHYDHGYGYHHRHW